MSTQITVRIGDELKDALNEAARRMHRKPSEVVRMALVAYLSAGSGDGRPADRVRHLLGKLDSGIPDLADRHREYILESLHDGE